MNKTVLIVDQNQKNLQTLKELLEKNSYYVTTIKSKSELDDDSSIGEVSLFLINAHVDFISVSEIFNEFDSHFIITPPIVFIDSFKEYDKQKLYECYELGAIDYIKKPFDSMEIIIKIDIHITQYVKLLEYRLRLDKLIALATTDQLSKFSSKMHIQAILKHTIELNGRHPSENSVLYLRLLDVEKVVSTFGFESGEKLIAIFSKALKKQLRESDLIGRWGGADFVILLPYTDMVFAYDVAKKLYAFLSKTEIVTNIRPNLSLGVTEITQEDTVESVLEKAKYAMDKASKESYGRVDKV